MQVSSLAWHSGLKDSALPRPWHRLQLWLGSDPWPGNSIHHRVAKKEKKRKEKKRKEKKKKRMTRKIEGKKKRDPKQDTS